MSKDSPTNQERIRKLVKELAGQANTLTIPRIFISLTEDIKAALLLSQCVYWSDRGRRGWFYKSYKEWQEELGLTQYEVKRCLGLIDPWVETKLKRANGAPTLHFYVHMDGLADSIITLLDSQETSESIMKKLDNLIPTNSLMDSEETSQFLTETTTETTPETTTEILAPAALPASAGETPEPGKAAKAKRKGKAEKDADAEAPELTQAKTEIARAYWRCLSKVEQDVHTGRKDYGRFVREALPGAVAGITPAQIAPAFAALKRDFRFRERTPAVRDVLDYIAAHAAPAPASMSELSARAARANAEFDATYGALADQDAPVPEAERVWRAVADRLRQQMAPAAWEANIKGAHGESLAEGMLTVAFPSALVIENVRDRAATRRMIDECLHAVSGNGTTLRYMARDTGEVTA